MNKVSQPIKVVLVEDDEVTRFGLSSKINQDPLLKVVGEAADRKTALSVVKSMRPDVILLDLNLGEESNGNGNSTALSGVDLIPELLSEAAGARIIIVTGVHSPEIHQRAIKQGAVGLVLKRDALRQITKAIKNVYEGDIWFDRIMMMKVISGMMHGPKGKPSDPETARIKRLTEREREVISLVGEGLKNKQIAGRLRPSVSENTVRHHMTSIFNKLEIEDRLELVIYAYIHGLAFLPKTLPRTPQRLSS